MASWGILNLNKPPGVTSRQVVNTVQRVIGRKIRVGHAGTLDPLACGVLVVPVGPATRLIEYIQQTSKTYRAEFLLGRKSNTEDTDGQVVAIESPPVPSREEIEAALPQFTGRIQQRPPAYSALRVDGKRAYDLARKGKKVELAEREIVIHRIELDGYEYPRLKMTIECGSGTYIRSLGRDLAASLGTGSVMSFLERTAIGPFSIEQAVEPDSLTGENWAESLLPAAMAVSHLRKLTLCPDGVRRIQDGLTIRCPSGIDSSREIVAVDEAERLIGIIVGTGGGELKTKRNFPTN